VPAISGLGTGVRVGKKMINNLGPVTETDLLPGEMVAVRTRRVLSRKGRCVVRVRVFGKQSLGWLDTAMLWGACVEMFVCQGGNVKHLIEQLYHDVHIAPLAEALEVPPHRSWDGVLLATIGNQTEGDHLEALIKKWRPLVVVIASHHQCISRATFDKLTDYGELGYDHAQKYVCWHNQFGGVTVSGWRMCITTTRLNESLNLSLDRMTASLYSRYLQTALDDTIGPDTGVHHWFDMNKRVKGFGDKLAVGVVNKNRPLFDSGGLGPDIAVASSEELQELWVLAASVFSKNKILRRITKLELLAIWDYAGKIWYKGMSNSEIKSIIDQRILSPPAKILTAVCFNTFQQLLERMLPATVHVVTSVK